MHILHLTFFINSNLYINGDVINSNLYVLQYCIGIGISNIVSCGCYRWYYFSEHLDKVEHYVEVNGQIIHLMYFTFNSNVGIGISNRIII
jgi:hypothetical protein